MEVISKMVKGKKNYRCKTCGAAIPKGQQHVSDTRQSTAGWQSKYYSVRTCLKCCTTKDRDE